MQCESNRPVVEQTIHIRFSQLPAFAPVELAVFPEDTKSTKQDLAPTTDPAQGLGNLLPSLCSAGGLLLEPGIFFADFLPTAQLRQSEKLHTNLPLYPALPRRS